MSLQNVLENFGHINSPKSFMKAEEKKKSKMKKINQNYAKFFSWMMKTILWL